MRRLPIYFLIDVSESMVGEPIEHVEDGMKTIVQELRANPDALETVFISVMVFAEKAKRLSPLTEIYNFYPPKFPIGGGTSLGNALNFLMDDIEKSVQKTTADVKGDWKPIIFLFTDGIPTDNPQPAIERWKKHFQKRCNLVCISLGDNADTQLLGKLTDNVLRLKETNENSFKAFFKWLSASIQTSSVAVTSTGDDDVQLAPTDNINLEKVKPNEACVVDENFVVLLGKCSTTKKTYLIKFAKRIDNMEQWELLNIDSSKYKFVGGYPVDEEIYNSLSDGASEHNINTKVLFGNPTCPCCGSQIGMVICQCGNISCADSEKHTCPWCGTTGILGFMGSDGANITRGKG